MGLGSLLDCEPAAGAVQRARRSDGTYVPEERPFACKRPRVQLVSSTTSGRLNVVEPEVAGLIDGGLEDLDAKFAHLPLSLAQRLFDTKDLSMVVLLLRDPDRGRTFARDLEEAARARGLALRAVHWREHTMGAEHVRGMKVLEIFRSIMAVVVVLIAGMTVLTTMAKAVSERTREIGTLRSLGFLRRQIVALFALEAALLAAVACTLGLALTLVAIRAVNGAGSRTTRACSPSPSRSASATCPPHGRPRPASSPPSPPPPRCCPRAGPPARGSRTRSRTCERRVTGLRGCRKLLRGGGS